MLVAALPARGSPRPAEETRAKVSLLFMWLELFCGWGLLSRRPRHLSFCFSASTSSLVFLSSSAWSSSAHNTGSANSWARVRTCSVGGKGSHQQRQLSNSHSRMAAGLPVRRSIIRHGFTELLSRGKRLFLAFLPGLLPCGLFRRLLGSFLLADGSLLGFNLVAQRVDQDRSAEVDAALLLAQRAYWIYLACATGRYETREQRSGQKDRNHDRKSR